MLCSECNKNPAILFYKKIENGKESLEGYCYDCAKAKGINPNEVLYKQNEILSKDNVNLNDMTKQFETIFKDLAENINLEDIENIDGAITFENTGDENGDGTGKVSGAAIPLSSLFSNMFGNTNNNNTSNENNTNTTETNQEETVNVTISLDGVEQDTRQAKVTESSFKAKSFTLTGTHQITVKVGSSYTRTREINFDESANNRQVIFDKDTVSD